MTTLDLLRVVNTGDKPLVLRHDGKGHVTIDPGRHRILPAEYAYLSFGDPRAVNQGKDKARDIELKNAQTAWGFYSGVYPETAWEGVGVTTEGVEVGPFKPLYECYDMEDNRVYLVADDPDGTLVATMTGVPTSDQSDRIERDAMAAQLTALQQQVTELRNLALMAQQGIAGPVPDIPEVGGFEEPDEGPEDDVEEDDDEPDEAEVSSVAVAAAKATKAPAKKAAAVKKAAASTQAKRNEARDSIPTPPANEAPVTADNPRTTRVGGR